MNLYIIVLGLIVVALLSVSVARLGKVKTKADYLVAGRSLPAIVLVFTLLSSWIGSGSLLAGAENAYKHGFAALWQSAGGWAGRCLCAVDGRDADRPVGGRAHSVDGARQRGSVAGCERAQPEARHHSDEPSLLHHERHPGR